MENALAPPPDGWDALDRIQNAQVYADALLRAALLMLDEITAIAQQHGCDLNEEANRVDSLLHLQSAQLAIIHGESEKLWEQVKAARQAEPAPAPRRAAQR